MGVRRGAGARRLVELASKQWGVVTRADLDAVDVSWKWLERRLRTGEWRRVHRGVFRLGCNPPSAEERDMAALLAAGEGAVLSHFSAARRLGLDVPRDDSVHVTIPEHRKAKVRKATVFRSRRLTSSDVSHQRRFRVTSLPRTLIDLASVLDDGWLRAAFESAVRQQRSYVEWISRTLAEHGSGRRGVARLRALVEEYLEGSGELTDSVLEALALELAKATGSPPKLHWNILKGARHVAEVDFAWPERRLCVQCDGWQWHGTRQAFVKDRRCDRQLAALGWMVLRYTWEDVARNREIFLEEVVQAFNARASVSKPSTPGRA